MRWYSGGTIAVTAADDVLVTSITDQHYAQDDEQKKGAFTSRMARDEPRKIDVVRSELDAKGDVLVESRTGDMTVRASRLRAEFRWRCVLCRHCEDACYELAQMRQAGIIHAQPRGDKIMLGGGL